MTLDLLVKLMLGVWAFGSLLDIAEYLRPKVRVTFKGLVLENRLVGFRQV